MIIRFTFLFLLAFCILSQTIANPAGPQYNIRDFGAKGNGTSTDSDTINAAIETASKAGGCTVYFPAGSYLSYSIRLKSHIAINFCLSSFFAYM